jgi:hypothetical protein
MFAQFGIEVICKRPKKKEGHLNFTKFGVRSSLYKRAQKKKTLMFECYNLVDPTEPRGYKFFRLIYLKIAIEKCLIGII